MFKLLAKVFGTKSNKDIKKLMPIIEQIHVEFEKLKNISDQELREKSRSLKKEIKNYLLPIDNEIESNRSKINDNQNLGINEKEEIFNQIDKLEKKRNEELETILMEILPCAFAVIKETARRFKENKSLEVLATMHDKVIASKKENVEIIAENAVWKNKWLASGNELVWDMIHYDEQLIGGIVLHQGKISEMATGEGKTLVATLPAFLNALAKRGVHIVTVNDYLAQRDSEWMAPIFEFHELTVDCIDKHEPNTDERKKAYACDIIYGTNNEFGFDYLRDNMSRDTNDLVQRKHHFAMIDEVDSVLIDEARTPLIISGPVPKGDVHEFYDLKPRIAKLVEAQKKLLQQNLLDAKKLLQKNTDSKEGGLSLFRTYRGLPKHKPLIKYLSEPGIRQILQKTENYYLQDNQKMMPEADQPLFFTIDEKHNSIELTEKGIDLITKEGEDANFFILPDIGDEITKIEKDGELSDQERVEKKDALINDYSIKSQRIHSVNQLLKAYTLFEKDTEYILVDGKVKIVDEQTGRVMEGRRYSDGLHQAIEAKENVKVEDATQTYATITLQNYFRMYHKLAGMTGTAETEAGEFWEIYKLDVVVIPTHRPIARNDQQDMVYKTVREKFNAVVEEINRLTKAGRPVLVGTTSVEISELVSRMLNLRKIKHQVLNAKQHAREADVVATAGQSGTVTIATNMAGRGTDIKLTQESKKAGGLAIVGTERHESRRVDRQLRGRSGRQGDPGTSQFFVSLEDNLMRMFMPPRVAKIMDKLGLQEGEVISHSMVTSSIERAQTKVEENNFGVRKRLLEYDNVMNSQREVIYKRRKNALLGERLQLDILNMLFDTCEDMVINAKAEENFDSFKMSILGILGVDYDITKEKFNASDNATLTQELYSFSLSKYKRKNELIINKALPIINNLYQERGASLSNILVPFTDGKKQIGVAINLQKCMDTEGNELVNAMEKMIALAIIDQLWKDHLREMDDLKQSVQNAVYEQKDPLLIYKFEGFELFKRFIAKVNEETISFLLKADLPIEDASQVQEAKQKRRLQLNEKKEESHSILNPSHSNSSNGTREKTMPIKSNKIYSRNDKVSVQYEDGSMLTDVKYKKVESDIVNNRCVVIEAD